MLWKCIVLLVGLHFYISHVESGKSEVKSYYGYSTYKINPQNATVYDKVLKKIHKVHGDLWSAVKPSLQIDVMLSPGQKSKFLKYLKLRKIPFHVMIPDVGKTVVRERKDQLRAQMYRAGGDDFVQDRFYRYNEMVIYMKGLAKRYPQICTLDTIGKTFEGRTIYMMKISTDKSRKKPIYLMEAGIHAREWAGPSSALYFMNQLIENNTYNARVLRDIDWYIIPVLNIDGYEYTHEVDRMWRKTRSRYPNSNCVGVDPNRNFAHYWAYAGSSSDPCSDTYHGPSALSEVETQNLVRVGQKYRGRIIAYTAIHAYGQYILYPWGYTKTLPADDKKMRKCSLKAAQDVKAYSGSKFQYGSSADVLYEAAGGSDDFFKGVLHVQQAYTIELTGGGMRGFDLPATQIDVVTREAFEIIKRISQCAVLDLYSGQRLNEIKAMRAKKMRKST